MLDSFQKRTHVKSSIVVRSRNSKLAKMRKQTQGTPMKTINKGVRRFGDGSIP